MHGGPRPAEPVLRQMNVDHEPLIEMENVMNQQRIIITTLSAVALSAVASVAVASEAETSAEAGTGYGRGNAEASARYEGQIGFARTNSKTGKVSLARGLAVGVDHNGLSLSASHALSLRGGVAVARNFNFTLGRNGQVAVSGGRSLSLGAHQRSAGVSGYSGVWNSQPTAVSTAYGKSDPRGIVKTRSTARTSSPRSPHRRRLFQPGCF